MDRKKELVKRLFNYKFKGPNKYLCHNGVYSPLGIACLVYQEDRCDLSTIIEEEIIKFDSSTFSLPVKVGNYFGIPYYLEKDLYNFCLDKHDSDEIALEFIHKLNLFPSYYRYSRYWDNVEC